MKINKEKMKLGFATFVHSSLDQLEQSWTWGMGLACGIYQGLKYNGDPKKGILTGVIVTGTIAATNGLMNVFTHRNKIFSE